MMKEMLETPKKSNGSTKNTNKKNNTTLMKKNSLSPSKVLSQTTMVHSLPPKQTEPMESQQKSAPTDYEKALQQTFRKSKIPKPKQMQQSDLTNKEINDLKPNNHVT